MSPDTQPVPQKKRILIIEDQRPLAHALEIKLTHEGFDVFAARNGRVGLEEALSDKYDLILLDLIIPEVDGYSILQRMHEKKLQTVTIILSNLGQEEDKKKAFGLGVKAYMVKATVPLSEIVAEVKKYL